MIASFIDSNGEDAAMALADSLFSIDHATKADLEPLATKDDLAAAIARCVTKDDLAAAIARCATKDDLAAAMAKCATKDDLSAAMAKCATKDDLTLLATKKELAELPTKAELKADIERALRVQGRWYVGAMAALVAAATGFLTYVG